MYERFADLLESRGVKPADITKETGIKSTVFSEWKKGKSTPNADKLVKIARFLDTTVEYLVTGEDPSPAAVQPTAQLSEDEQKLLGLYRRMDPIQKGQTIGYMNGLLDKSELSKEKLKENEQLKIS